MTSADRMRDRLSALIAAGHGRSAAKAANAPPAPPDCVHLGHALPLQPGCGCAEKRRECSEFGECSLKPSKADHHCLNANGSVACPAYEPRD